MSREDDEPRYQEIRESLCTWIIWRYRVSTDHTSWEKVGRVVYADCYYHFEKARWTAEGVEFDRVGARWGSVKAAWRAHVFPPTPPPKMVS